MIAIRKAGLCVAAGVAAGLLVGCQGKRQEPAARAPEPPSMQAAESLRRDIVRANPDARVGIVAATFENFAAVSDVPAGTVPENASVQILDPNGEVVGYGLVRAVKDNAIHVLYQSDARRGPQVGDLVMPASDAGLPVAEEMPAAAPIAPGADQPAAEEQPAEPSRLPPRRSAETNLDQPEPAQPPVDPAPERPAQPEQTPPAATDPAPEATDTAQSGADAPAATDAAPDAPAAEPAAPGAAPEQPAPEQPAAEKPAAEQPAAEQPAAEQPADDAGKSPEAEKPDQNK